MVKRVLIVYPYAFGTGWGGATPRILHIAQGLGEHGWEVTLLRCKQANESELEAICASFPGRVITAPFNGPYPAAFNQRGLRNIYRLWLRLRRQSISGDPTFVLADRLLEFAKSQRDLPRPSLVWGITVGFLTGPAAALKIANLFKIPFVVEFHDPVPHPGRPRLAPAQEILLKRCLSQASLVVTTTNGITKYVEEQFPVAAGKTRTFYLTYDDSVPPAHPATRPANNQLILAHAGVLYGGNGRNASSLVKALAQAADADPTLARRIRMKLIGAGTGGEEAANLARTLNIPWAVEIVPQIPPDACQREMDTADVLVAIKFDDPEYDLQIPGKIFQYLGRGKPVLGLMRETEAAKILRNSGLSIIAPHGDVNAIADALLVFWRRRDRLSEYYVPNWPYISQFSLSDSASRLDRELQAVLSQYSSVGAAGYGN